MPAYRTFVLDLDGTLLNKEKRILPRTREALETAASTGAQIVICTGRAFFGIPEEIRQLKGISYAITCNGAAVYDFRSGKLLKEDPLTRDEGIQIAEELGPKEILVDFLIAGRGYMEERRKHLLPDIGVGPVMEKYLLKSTVWVPSLREMTIKGSERVQKVTMNFISDGNGGYLSREEVLAFARKHPDLECVSGGNHNLEFTRKGVTKGTSLQELCELLHIRKSEVLAVGDSGNDASMLKAAGRSVAMGNASKDIIELSDEVTSSCDEDGVAQVIEKYWLSGK